MLSEGEYTVRYVKFPPLIPGLTAKDESGHYNIYINSLLSASDQEKALKHELEHAISEDFDISKPIEQVEPYRCFEPVVEKENAIPELAKEPPPPSPSKAPQKVEIATLGQLMRFMVNCENKRKNARQQAKKRVSIDICGER